MFLISYFDFLIRYYGFLFWFGKYEITKHLSSKILMVMSYTCNNAPSRKKRKEKHVDIRKTCDHCKNLVCLSSLYLQGS